MAPRPARRMLGLACCVLLASVCHGVAPSTASAPIAAGISKAHHSHSPFSSPTGYFIQERASKQLPSAGQHFNFGALRPWEEIVQLVEQDPDSKLLLLIRHGQAVSNWLQDKLGPDDWFAVESKCNYTSPDGEFYSLFDADLTDTGIEQAKYLNSILNGGGWFAKMTGRFSSRVIVSPLSRCLNTAMLVAEGLNIKGGFSVEELVRETLGEDTCDARRAASDPDPKQPFPTGPCAYEQGLRSKFPKFRFPVIGSQEQQQQGNGFGLISDEDILWTKTREEQKDQVKRATRFLNDLFESAEENVIPVITHSGFIRSLLLAVSREPYRPQNTELVPVVVTRRQQGRQA